MARTTLAEQQSDENGTTLTMSAANVDGHFIDGGASGILLVQTSGTTTTVTIQTPGTEDGLAIAEQSGAVGATALVAFGPFTPSTYDRPTGAADAGKVYVDFSSVTGVTVAFVGV